MNAATYHGSKAYLGSDQVGTLETSFSLIASAVNQWNASNMQIDTRPLYV